MGSNGSRVIKINNIEQHFEMCESLGQKSKPTSTKDAPSTDNSTASTIKAWTSISPKVSPANTPTPALFTTSSNPTTSSSPTSPSLKTSVPNPFPISLKSSKVFAKWQSKDNNRVNTLELDTIGSPSTPGGVWSGKDPKIGPSSKYGKKASQKEFSFPHSR